MNRAEKMEPLPSCRGTHKGHPIRGDFMFSNKIPLGLLSEAYGLSMEECLELIGRVNVVSHTFNVPPSDVEATASRVTDRRQRQMCIRDRGCMEGEKHTG